MGRKRPHQYVLRLSTEETWALYNLVESSGMSQQEYMRKSVLGQKIVNTAGIRSLVSELKRIGNNLNQIARASNAGSPAAAAEVEEIRKELNAVWQQLKRFLQNVE